MIETIEKIPLDNVWIDPVSQVLYLFLFQLEDENS